jgi:UDP-glucose 4-epimerase
MKLLLTGATGFVGQRLLSKIPQSDEIFAICRNPVVKLPANVSVIRADLNRPEDLRLQLKALRPDACLHLAWEGLPDYGYESSRRNLDQGTALFRCLLEECGCRKIIATGTCWEYGRSFGACHEDDKVAPSSYFTWAKLALADLGWMLSAKHQGSFIWMRVFYAYGSGQRSGSLIPTMADALRKQTAPAVKTPLNANDFIHVDDIAEALKLAVEKDIPSGIYNLGSGQSVPVWKVCEYLEQAMGHKPLYARRLQETAVQPTADFWADITKTREVLGWVPKISMEEGLRLTAAGTASNLQ